jgi:hypothetical protein
MAFLTMMPYLANQVTRDPMRHRFLVEASELGLAPGHVWDRIYSDRGGVGIALKSPKTGYVTRWQLNEELTTDQAWYFTPVPRDVQEHPALKSYELVIYNT